MISATIQNIPLMFDVTLPPPQQKQRLFSPHSIDHGTLAMLSLTEFLPADRVLDLGCGYGVVGILAAKKLGPEQVVMCDISQEAVDCARQNAALNGVPGIDIRLSDGFEQIPDKTFTLILSNPPYHADFSVPKRFIEGSFQRLETGGRLMMVTKRLDWYKNKIISVFGGVKIHEMDGYYIFMAEKRSAPVKKPLKAPPKLSKKLRAKYNKPI